VLILVGEPLSYAAQSFAPQYFTEGSTAEDKARGFYYVRLIVALGGALSAVMLLLTRASFLPLCTLFTRDALIQGKATAVINQVSLSVCAFPILLSLEGSLLAVGRVRSLVWAMATNVGYALLNSLSVIFSLRRKKTRRLSIDAIK